VERPNIDAPILDGLSGLIENTGYQPASVDQVPAGVKLDMAGPDAGGSQNPGLQAGNAIAPGPQFVEQPVTQQPIQQPAQQPATPQADPRLAHFEQVAFDAAQKRIEAEEELFRVKIADLSEAEQRAAIAERERDQTKEVNLWLNQERERERTQIQSQQQQASKRSWAFIFATQAGLPFDNEAVQAALLGARNREQMATIAQNLAGLANAGQGQQATAQLQNGTFAAGGNNGAAAPAVKPVPRSGDIGALIESRNYQNVNWG
jgi:hypothetical protein